MTALTLVAIFAACAIWNARRTSRKDRRHG